MGNVAVAYATTETSITCKSYAAVARALVNAVNDRGECQENALASPALASSKRFRGIIKSFKSSFGWIACEEVSRLYDGWDVFLHKNDCSFKPRKWGDEVVFSLTLDEGGHPKAVR